MAKPKFVTDGDSAVEINWVIKVLDKCNNIEKNKAYKVIAIIDETSLAVIVPFSDVKDLKFNGVRDRNYTYRRLKTSIPLYSKVAVYGTHLDNLEKAEKDKENNKIKKLEKEERLRALSIGEDLKGILIDVVRDYESALHNDLIKRFEKQLELLKVDGLFYKCEFKEITMTDISKTSLKTLGNQGWSFCFEYNGKFYFQRPRLKNKKN